MTTIDKNLHKKLIDASFKNDLELVKVILEDGGKLTKFQLSAIKNAAFHHNKEMLEILISSLEDLSISSAYIADWSAEHNYIEPIEVLVKNNIPVEKLKSALVAAIAHNNVEIYSFLLEQNIDLQYCEDYAIRTAVARSDVKLLKGVLSQGADLSKSNYVALLQAIKYGSVDIINQLCEHGANYQVLNYEPVIEAIRLEKIEVLEYFMEKGLSIEIIEEKNKAIINDNEKVAAWLNAKKLEEHLERNLDNKTNKQRSKL